MAGGSQARSPGRLPIPRTEAPGTLALRSLRSAHVAAATAMAAEASPSRAPLACTHKPRHGASLRTLGAVQASPCPFYPRGTDQPIKGAANAVDASAVAITAQSCGNIAGTDLSVTDLREVPHDLLGELAVLLAVRACAGAGGSFREGLSASRLLRL